MKNCFYLMTLALILWNTPATLHAQSVAINTDGSVPDASAILDLKSADKGVLVPRMTAAQRSAIANPSKGLLVFQTDPVPAFCYYNGFSWINLTNGYVVNSSGYSGSYGYTTTVAPMLNLKRGMATDSKGNVYVTTMLAHCIFRISVAGVVTVFAGDVNISAYLDATGIAARFQAPAGIAIDAADNLYVCDQQNHAIRKITPAGVVTTYFGTNQNIVITRPFAIAIDVSDNVYVANVSHEIYKIGTNQVASWLAGLGVGYKDTVVGEYAQFDAPRGLAVDSSGNLFVADFSNHCIRKITPGAVVSTFAGIGDSTGNADGPAATATFNGPHSIVIDRTGNFYVAEQFNHKIRKITPDGIVSTLAGNGLSGHVDGPDISALFSIPTVLALDLYDNLYVGEVQYIRKIILR